MRHEAGGEIEPRTVRFGHVADTAEAGWQRSPGGPDTRHGPTHNAPQGTRWGKETVVINHSDTVLILILVPFLFLFQGMGSIYSNPELEMIAKEIQVMLSEKMAIEKEVQEIEYGISVKNTETHSLQSEYDTLAATLKQLTNQRDVAQKRLDDLDTQVKGPILWYHSNEEKKID